MTTQAYAAGQRAKTPILTKAAAVVAGLLLTVCAMGLVNGTKAQSDAKAVRDGVAAAWEASLEEGGVERLLARPADGVRFTATPDGVVVQRDVSEGGCRMVVNDPPPHATAVSTVPDGIGSAVEYAKATNTLVVPSALVADRMCRDHVTLLVRVAKPAS